MAFHGSRGTPRMRGPRSGGFGGRGGNSGGSRGRGRGRRTGLRGGKPIFDSARLAGQKQEGSEVGEDITSESDIRNEVESEDVSTGENDEDDIPTIRPYTALLQSLANDSAPQAKRRKLEGQLGPDQNKSARNDEAILNEENDLDRVEEPEEGAEMAVDGLLEDEDHQFEDKSDPFEARFANPDDNVLSRRLKAMENKSWITQKLIMPNIGKAVIGTPEDIEDGQQVNPSAISGPADLRLKQKFSRCFAKQNPTFDPLEQAIAPFIFDYHDMLFCERLPANSEHLRRLSCLHAVNHIFKTRDRVIKNNARLAKEEGNDDLDLRDQGFTRPKVLMLLPTRQSCVKWLDMIISLCEPEQQENRKRFDDSYVEKDEKFLVDKPEDFQELFAGNDDDMFRLGIKFTRKTIKYFSQFYNSDIIFASPLGLRMAIGNEEDMKVDCDFLSSIEIIIIDQAHALPMQNWEHVELIFEHLNLQPKEAHGCDFGRVRSWYLDNHAKHFRQMIALTAFNTPELNTLLYNSSKNWTGKIKINKNYPGAIQELGMKVKQTFSRLESPILSSDPDTRFTYFTTAIIPSLVRHKKDCFGTIVFVPSYLDFVRVRNYFSTSATTSNLSFGTISEYTSVQDVARARSHFLSGRHSILLYTERAHHFRRYRLRGVKKVIMYGLPDNPDFYKEMVGGYLGGSVRDGRLDPNEASVRVLFSKWDLMKLERVAGTERVGKMIRDKGDTFDFL